MYEFSVVLRTPLEVTVGEEEEVGHEENIVGSIQPEAALPQLTGRLFPQASDTKIRRPSCALAPRNKIVMSQYSSAPDMQTVDGTDCSSQRLFEPI